MQCATLKILVEMSEALVARKPYSLPTVDIATTFQKCHSIASSFFFLNLEYERNNTIYIIFYSRLG
jgi:hypothetical protein